MTIDSSIEQIKELVDRMSGDEKHDEASLTTLVPLFVLYDRILRVDPRDPGWEGRDRFILSKGHGPSALYAILATKGFFPLTWLDRAYTSGSILGSHPDRLLVPGVEASTGSLGHGLPMGVGVALGLRAKGDPERRIVVMCGDGELNEGSNWEAILLAANLALSSLTLVVIDNHSSSMRMPPWPRALGSFGWSTILCEGGDAGALEAAFAAPHADQPLAVIAEST